MINKWKSYKIAFLVCLAAIIAAVAVGYVSVRTNENKNTLYSAYASVYTEPEPGFIFIICSSENGFSLSVDGSFVLDEEGESTREFSYIYEVMDFINDENEENGYYDSIKAVQFGDGDTVFDLGSSNIVLKNGMYIFSGKVVSVYGMMDVIHVDTGVTLYIGSGEVCQNGNFCAAINNYGTVNIGGGKVIADSGYQNSAICNNYTDSDHIGTVNIYDGEVSSTGYNCMAINNGGTTNIYGGEVCSTGDYGSAIYNSGGIINVYGGEVCTTNDYSSAINNDEGKVDVYGGEVSATGGTAIYNFSTVNVYSGEVTAADNGTAVYNYGSSSTIDISGGSITAVDGSAAVANTFGEVSIADCSVTATNSSMAICNLSGTISIDNCFVTATGDGCTAIRSDYSDGEVSIADCTVSATGDYCLAISNYGGILNIKNSSVKAAGSGCTAIFDSSGETHITDSRIESIGGTAVSVYYGFAAIDGEKTFIISDSEYTIETLDFSDATDTCLHITGGIIENTFYLEEDGSASGGTAIYNVSNRDIEISGCEVNALYRTIANYGASIISLAGCNVSGGFYAIFNYGTGTVNIDGCTVEADKDSGEAIVNYDGTVNITGSSVSLSGNYGAAITNSGGELNIYSGIIQITGQDGYAISNYFGIVNISGGTVKAKTGIAIYCSAGEITISQADGETTLITSANTNSYSGTIVIYFSSTLYFKSGMIENSALTGARGLVEVYESAIDFGIKTVTDSISYDITGTPVYTGSALTPATITQLPAADYTPVYASNTNAGTALVKWSLKSASTGSTGVFAGRFTIAQKTITIAASTYTINKVYDGTTAAGTASGVLSITGIVAADATAGVKVTATPGAYSNKNAGNYTITVGLTITGDTNGNYKLSSNSININNCKITAKAIAVTANPGSKTYGNTTFTNTGYTVETGGLLTGDILSGTAAYTTTAMQYSAAGGSYTISVSGLSNGNYSITFIKGTLTVTPRAITVAINNASKTYGNANPTFTYERTNLLNGNTLTGSAATAAGQYSVVGTYDITAGTLANSNYTITFMPGTLTINQKEITVTANAGSKTYGDTTFTNTGYTVQAGGLVNGDTLSGTAEYNITATQYGAVGGSFTISVSGLSNSNYSITFTSGTLTVTPKAITIKIEDKSKTYGDANPTFTYERTNLLNDDTLSGTAATVAGQFSNVNTYDITAGTLANGNYDITFTSGTLTITPRAITVAINNASKTYGNANPIFTYERTNLLNGNTLTGSAATAAGQYSVVGTYDITAGTLANANYSITFTKGTLTINPKTITIIANAGSKTYGDTTFTNTGYTVQAGGLVNGDILSGTAEYNITATQYSAAGGSYTISVGGLSNSNYSIAFAHGTLTINPKAIAVIIDNVSKTYGDKNPSFTYEKTNLLNNDTLTGTAATTATQFSGVNIYPITAGTLANSNYSITFISGTLTVNQKAITVTANAGSKTYGDTTFANSGYMVIGLVNEDTLSGTAIYDTSATQFSPVSGNYIISVRGLSNGNYDITFIDGVLIINKADGCGTVSIIGWTFNDTANNPVTTEITHDGTLTAWYCVTENGMFVTTVPTAAGMYYVKIICTNGSNYNDYATAAVSFTIARANGSGSVTMQGWTYGGNASTPVSDSSTNGMENVTYEYKIKGAADSTYTSEKPTIAGEYTVRAIFGATANYESYTAMSDFTITEATGGNNNLSGGEIAGIAVGSIVLIGIFSLSIFWFIIKKKKIADLAAIFKKKL